MRIGGDDCDSGKESEDRNATHGDATNALLFAIHAGGSRYG